MTIMGIWIDNQAGQGGNGGGETPKEVSWNDIQGKPSSFVPSPHKHKIEDVEELQYQLGTKVDKKNGYGLSQENFTPEFKNKLESVPEKIVTSVNGDSGEVEINKESLNLGNVDNIQQATKTEFDSLSTKVDTNIANIKLKVDKEDGKGLSSNDFTDEYKTKIDTNGGEIETIKGSLGNMKGIIISSEKPAYLYEGLIWIKPLEEG